jgi:multiple sugar transport system permease protein
MTGGRGRPDGLAATGRRGKFSPALSVAMFLALAYCLLPLVWLMFSATKSTDGLFSSFGLWFSDDFHLIENIQDTFAYDDGIFARWLLNTAVYSLVGAGGATLLAALAGYGLAMFSFPGRRLVFAVILGAVMVPTTALAVPTYLLFSSIGLVDTPMAVIIPALASPFGVYLMFVFIKDAVPDALVEAARVDGGGELTIFWRVCVPLLGPGLVTVMLFQVVATWNNYFLPLILLNDPINFPLPVGLQAWNSLINTSGGAHMDALYPLILTGALISTIPLVCLFLVLQRYWRSGLAAGSVK